MTNIITDRACDDNVDRSAVSGRPSVKRFALCYRTVVCLSCPVCLSVL